MEKIDRYDVDVYNRHEDDCYYAVYELHKCDIGDLVLYEDHERIVKALIKKHEDELERAVQGSYNEGYAAAAYWESN